MALRVGINAFEVIFGEGSGPGAGIYAIELLKGLLKLPGDAEYVVFVNRQAQAAGWFPASDRCTQHVVALDARRKVLRPVWEQVGLPLTARRLGLDVIHSPFNTCPLTGLGTPVVATVHDLVYFYYRAHFPQEVDLKARYYTALQPVMFRRAAQVMASSQFTHQQLVERLGVRPERVITVPLGSGQSLEADGRMTATLGAAPGQPAEGDILLTVASGLLHKNLLRLLEACARAPLPRGMRLVVVGEIPQQPRPRMVTQSALLERAATLGIGDRVQIYGYLPAEELASLYRRAVAFVFPSLYEGFGLPLLEAMRWGVPVISSHNPPLPEVGGDAAAYFDPHDVDDMARVIRAVLGDRELRRTLVERGSRRLAQFGWDQVAARVLDNYRTALAQRGR